MDKPEKEGWKGGRQVGIREVKRRHFLEKTLPKHIGTVL